MFQVSRRFKRFELLGRFPPFPNSSKGWQFRDDIGAGDMAERNPARLFETWNQKCWKFQTAAADKSPCQKFLKALRRRPWDWLDVRHVSTTFLLLPPSRPGLKPRSLCFLMEFGRNLRGWMDGPRMVRDFYGDKKSAVKKLQNAWTCDWFHILQLAVSNWGLKFHDWSHRYTAYRCIYRYSTDRQNMSMLQLWSWSGTAR